MATRYQEFYGTERFRVFRRLGEGGMGVVYEALDRERGVRVALKTVRRHNGDVLLRLKNEFRALQGLDHPNLVQLGELLEADGHWFFTMELVEGVPFTDYVRQSGRAALGSSAGAGGSGDSIPDDDGEGWHASDVRQALAFDASPDKAIQGHAAGFDDARLRATLSQLIKGLLALHGTGKVHRDIKPPNVLVTSNGRVVILDFGLAAEIEPHADFATYHIVGTAHYMAPDQAFGKPVGPEADWYSVGVMIYEALTGILPFRGNPAEVLAAKQSQDPVPARSLNPFAPEDLAVLCTELLQRSPAQRPSGKRLLARMGAADASAQEDSARETATAPASSFVGRHHELDALGKTFADIQVNRLPRAVIIEGESGVGKSALVRSFTDKTRAREPQTVVLAGRCYERELVPYKAVDGVIDALSRYMMRLSDPDAAALLPRAAGLIGDVFPVLRRVRTVAQAPRPHAERRVDQQELRTLLFAAMRELLGRLADRHPLVLIVDDMHWADADGIALLSEVLRPPEAPALMLLATVRTGALAGSSDGTPSQSSAFLPSDHQRIRLSRLAEDEALHLAMALMPDKSSSSAGVAAKIAYEAQGHPLFIHELIRHAASHPDQAPGDFHLDDVLRTRVAELTDSARKILELIAVAGRPVVQEIVALAAAMSPSDYARCLVALRAANLVQTSGPRRTDTIAAYHDRVRESTVSQLEPETLTQDHRELALALEASGPCDPEALAEHWKGAGELERAASYAIRAATEADAMLAFDHAAKLYRIALELRPFDHDSSHALRVKLATALANGGRSGVAAQTFLFAAANANASETLDLHRQAAEQFLRGGYIDDGLQAIRKVLAVVGMALPKTPWRALLSLLICRALVRLRGLWFRERTVDEILPQSLSRLDACWAIGSVLAMVDNIRGADFNGRSLLMALRAGEPMRLIRVLAHESMYIASSGGKRNRRSERLLGITAGLAEKYKVPEAQAWALAATGVSNYLQGRFAAANKSIVQAEIIFREKCTGSAWEIATLRMYHAFCLVHMGQIASVARTVRQQLAEALDRGDLYRATNLRLGMLNLAWLTSDNVDEARKAAREASQRWSHDGYHLQHYYDLLAESNIDLYVGDNASAYDRVTTQWKALAKSMLLRIQIVRIEAYHLRGRCCLALAQTISTDKRDRLLSEASHYARVLHQQSVDWSAPAAFMLQAGVCSCRGNSKKAIELAEASAKAAKKADLELQYAVACRRLGQLIGGSDGRERIEAANAWMTDQTLKNRERWTAMFAPGFPFFENTTRASEHS